MRDRTTASELVQGKRRPASGARVRALWVLALVLAIAAEAQPFGEFVLVADLEDDRSARPAYAGWAWNLAEGTVLLGGGALWRVGAANDPPRLLLRDVEPWTVHPVDGGELVVNGRDPAEGDGLWVTDGGRPRRLAPAGFRIFSADPDSRVARHGSAFLAKTIHLFPNGLWRFSEHAAPELIGPDLAFDHSDGLFTYDCTGMIRAAGGFVDCGSESWLELLMRFTPPEAVPGTSVHAAEFPYLLTSRGIELEGYRWLHGQGLFEPAVLLRTDGTRAGTTVVAQASDPPFDLWGEVGWFHRPSGGAWQLMATNGASMPRVFAAGGPPYWASASEPAGDELYLLDPNWSLQYTDVWAISRSGSLRQLGTLDGLASSPLVATGRGSEAIGFVAEPYPRMGWALWRITAEGKLETLTAPSFEWPSTRTLPSVADGLPIPFVDDSGDARPGSLASDGRIEPLEVLILPGTAGSAAEVIGTLGGLTLLYAETEQEGPALWLSNGHPGGTTLLDIPTACTRFLQPRPVLEPSGILVDCRDDAGTVAVWLLDGAQSRSIDIDPFFGDWVGRPSPRVARVGDSLIYPRTDGTGIALFDLATGVETVILPGCFAVPMVAGNHAVFTCGGSLWSSDGTLDGTLALLPPPSIHGGLLTPAGGRVVVSGTPGWITDGTPAGTREIPSLLGAASAPPEARWTCAWNGAGLLRIDLRGDFDELIVPIEMLTGGWAVEEAEGPGRVILVHATMPHREEFWWCTGDSATSHPIPAPSGPVDHHGWASHPSGIWRSVRTARFERIEHHRLGDPGWTTALVQERPINDDGLGQAGLRIAGGRLWTTLADEEHGREPWVLSLASGAAIAVFADGFESGGTGNWSGTP